MTRLFIENREIDLDESVQFAITKQFEDLSNPTDIINDWSKTVSIPFTCRNNAIFGQIYCPDKLIVEGGSGQTLTGIYFNPYKKLNMRLQWGDDVLMIGYAKMNEVKQQNGKGTYELTLFGQLGKVFQEMQKITFDTTTDDTDYLIHGEEYVSENINRNLIYNSWNSPSQTQDKIKKVNEYGYNVTDIIGFAPNNSFSEGFDYKSYQSNANESKLFTEILGDDFKNATGIEASTIIPNGLLPRELGEYRSYLQLPYIYWNKLFQIFQAKAEEITGYDFELDGTWFNKLNPYWHDLVYMLKPFDSKNEETTTNYYMFASFGLPWGGDINEYVQPKSTVINFNDRTESIQIIDSNNMVQLSYDYTIIFNTIYTIDLDISNYNNLRLNPENGLSYSFLVKDENSNVVDTVRFLMVDNSYSGSTNGYSEVLRFGRIGSGAFSAYPKLNLVLDKGKYNGVNKVKLELQAVWLNTNAPFLDNNNNPFMPSPTHYTGYINLHLYNVPINNPISCMVIKNRFRSNNHFNLNNLWNNDYNVFGEIIKYCKMYRINITVDEYNKKIRFTQYPTYFDNYSIKDWSTKIDKSKDFNIKPITFENKYILFNYKDAESNLGKRYKEKFGVNYGEYRLITDYNFNGDTKALFKDITPSITNTDNVLSWTNIFDNHQIIYSFPDEIYVYNKDKDNKQVNIFGAYYFHNGLKAFNTETALRLRSVRITDDTTFQQANSTYFYSYGLNYIGAYYYPHLDIVKDDNMCVFNVPSENYTYLNNYSGKQTIYTNFWEKYIYERYNIQNKKITCYSMIKPSEYNNFDWKQFVKIGNQLCIVNKIYDYDVTSIATTKVDLITIQDIDGYNDKSFINSIDILNLNLSSTVYFGGGIMDEPSLLTTFDTVTDVKFANNSKTYIINNVKFTISGDSIYYQNLAEYLDKDDIEFTVELHNDNHSASFNCVRFSTYPYPWIIIEDSNGNEVSSIYPGSRVYKFKWHGTETEGLSNKPTIVIENHGTGSATIGNDWVENEVMIQEGGDEWFRNEYEVSLNTNMTNYSGSYLRFIVTDKEGWHETRDYPISL